MDDLRREIDDENELIDMVKQVEAELRNLQSTLKEEDIEQLAHHSSHTLPEIRSQIDALKGRSADASKRRRVVQPSAPMGRCETLMSEVNASVNASLESLLEEQQNSMTEKIKAMLAHLQQQPTAEDIQQLEQQLDQLGFTNPNVEELQQNLAQIKQNQAEKDKAKKEIEQQLELMSNKLKQIYEQYPATTKETKSKKRKKGQQQKPAEAKEGDRKAQIHELKKNVDELESVVLPSLAKLKEDASTAQLETALPEQQQARAAELVLALKVSLFRNRSWMSSFNCIEFRRSLRARS
jgi:chromosome segregation ATPase